MWLPLLDSKFDGRYDDLPATYIWARTRRMSGARDRNGREVMGWIEGGYETLIDAVARRVRLMGGEFHTGAAVEQIVYERGRVVGVRIDGVFTPYDAVLCTLTPPQRMRLFAPDVLDLLPVDGCRYLGVICLVLKTSKSITPYYTLNITDRQVPLTTIVETTHVTDPATSADTWSTSRATSTPATAIPSCLPSAWRLSISPGPGGSSPRSPTM